MRISAHLGIPITTEKNYGLSVLILSEIFKRRSKFFEEYSSRYTCARIIDLFLWQYRLQKHKHKGVGLLLIGVILIGNVNGDY